MSTPITFTTEAERLKAREQYVAIRKELHRLEGTDPSELGPRIEEEFDRAFPPIAPPKMAMFLGWAILGPSDEVRGVWRDAPTIRNHYERLVRVRVVEVDDAD